MRVKMRTFPWDVLCLACLRLLKAAKAAHWTAECLVMLGSFFGGLIDHPWNGSHDPLQRCALQVYMAKQHWLWHSGLSEHSGQYNISIHNKELLMDTYNRTYQEDHRCLDALAHTPNVYVPRAPLPLLNIANIAFSLPYPLLPSNLVLFLHHYLPACHTHFIPSSYAHMCFTMCPTCTYAFTYVVHLAFTCALHHASTCALTTRSHALPPHIHMHS